MSNLRLLDPVFGDSLDSALRRFFPAAVLDNEAPQLNMRIDVTENETGYTVHADLPGVNKDDINVRVEGNMVQIDAETRSEKVTKDKGDKVLRSERYAGTISRAFSLGQDVEADKVEARYADGVLTLQLPKKASAESRKITIQ